MNPFGNPTKSPCYKTSSKARYATFFTCFAALLHFSPAAQADNKKLKGTIKIDGSSTTFPITEAVAEEFRNEAPRVRVMVGISGTGGGFHKFGNGEIAINNASRAIKANEVAQAKKHGIDFLELPVANDGITIVVNQKNTWVKSLTVAQLKELWQPGSKITTWKQLDESWPDEKIKLYGPGTDSGTFDYFTEDVVGEAKKSRNDYTASEDDNVLVTGISGDKNSLGYFGYAYYAENKSRIKAVPISDGKDAAVAPSETTIQNSSYPLSRPLYIYVSSKYMSRPEVKLFVDFFLKNAGFLVKDVGYSPLPDDKYKKALERFHQQQVGHWNISKK